VSDGTLKMFAYLILLHDPVPYPLLCIEEPENFLHHALMNQLAEEFREYANNGGQVFISTHSPEFVNALNIEEVYWLTKESGFSIIKKASETEIVEKMVQEGEPLGQLWKQGYLKGSNPIENH
ncbi:MAG: AAA family ATPase, partial [Ignavibacteriaceae bacterium]|nr:AAA family ATPase [Ignavibacteriaceae bacterium]